MDVLLILEVLQFQKLKNVYYSTLLLYFLQTTRQHRWVFSKLLTLIVHIIAICDRLICNHAVANNSLFIAHLNRPRALLSRFSFSSEFKMTSLCFCFIRYLAWEVCGYCWCWEARHWCSHLSEFCCPGVLLGHCGWGFSGAGCICFPLWRVIFFPFFFFFKLLMGCFVFGWTHSVNYYLWHPVITKTLK